MFDFERDTIEHSPDAGRTWNVIQPIARSALVVNYLPPLAELAVYDDGMGNTYRWRQGRPQKRISHN